MSGKSRGKPNLNDIKGTGGKVQNADAFLLMDRTASRLRIQGSSKDSDKPIGFYVDIAPQGAKDLSKFKYAGTIEELAASASETKARNIEAVRKALEASQLKREVKHLRREQKNWFGLNNIVAVSGEMKRVIQMVEKMAQSDASTVLIQGESGTGKEMAARAVHFQSARRDNQFVSINCAALPENLLESELFGREKGAYTGAMTKMIGRFEIADGSTLFLDEIGELPLELQSKLLRVLEEIDDFGSNLLFRHGQRFLNDLSFSSIVPGRHGKDFWSNGCHLRAVLRIVKDGGHDISAKGRPSL
jgi:transcriptional regulator of acetoin/glycerol metabolism